MEKVEPVAIQIILVDGHPEGVVLAEIQDWSGQIAVSPRNRIHDLEAIVSFNSPGIYLLIGESQNTFGERVIYVGESESTLGRPKQHPKSKDKTFWHTAILLRSSSGSLNKAHIKSLEAKIISELGKSGVIQVFNQNTSLLRPHLALHDSINVDRYFSRFKLILLSLEMDFFSPRRAVGMRSVDNQTVSVLNYVNPIFECNTVGVHAKGRVVGREFVVARDSTFRFVPGGQQGLYASQLIHAGILTVLRGNSRATE